MNHDLSSGLDKCLDDLAKGQSLEECLNSHPEAVALSPILSLAVELKELPQPEPRREALQGLLVKAGASLPKHGPGALLAPEISRARWAGSRRPIWPTLRWASALAACAVVAFGVGTAASQSLPGSVFYPIKLFTERVTFALTIEPAKRAELRLSFADDRLDELARSAREQGKLDPALLRQVLRESELALQDARPLPEPRFRTLLANVNTSNSYQRTVLAQVNKWLPSGDRGPIEKAISTCDERERWLREVMTAPANGSERDRSWGPGCNCD